MVLDTTGALTYVGRYDSEDAAGVHLLDVGVHDAADSTAGSREEFVRRSIKFGIRTDHKQLIVPAAEVAGITKLGELVP